MDGNISLPKCKENLNIGDFQRESQRAFHKATKTNKYKFVK